MFKKMILVAVVGGLAVAAFKGTRMASYVRNEIRSLHDAAEDEIPLEKRVAMLEDGVNRLDRFVLKKVKEVSVADADLQLVERDVKALADRQAGRKKELADRLAAAKAAGAAGTVPVVAGRDRSLADLDRDSATWEAQQRVLADMTSNRDTLRQHVTVLDDQLKTMVAERDGMRARVRALKVEVERVKLQQLKSRTPAGDSEIAKMKQEFRDLERKLLAEQKVIERLPAVDDEPVAPAAASIEAIEARLNGGKADQKDKE